MKRLKGAGVTGETVLTGSEQTLSLGQFDLTVDWLRNAVGFNKRATKRANFDAVMVAGTQLSDWMARATDDDLMSELVGPAGSEAVTTIRAGGKTSDANLTSADVFNSACLDRIKVALLRKGAIPFQVKSVNGATLKFFGVVIDPIDAYNLRGDDAWFSAQRDANLRGLDNPIFSGAFVSKGSYGSNVIKSYSVNCGKLLN